MIKIISDHGFPKGDGSLPTDDAFDRFKNEREYVAQSGRMQTTVAAMDWAAAEIERLRGDAADLQATFDLQWEADMRAVKLWREAHPGNELVLPDRANMVVWLLEQHDARAQRALWQPIETAPQDRTWVLVWEAEVNQKYHPAEVARFVNNRWESSAMKYVNAVYWMPIPALTSTDGGLTADEKLDRARALGQARSLADGKAP